MTTPDHAEKMAAAVLASPIALTQELAECRAALTEAIAELEQWAADRGKITVTYERRLDELRARGWLT